MSGFYKSYEPHDHSLVSSLSGTLGGLERRIEALSNLNSVGGDIVSCDLRVGEIHTRHGRGIHIESFAIDRGNGLCGKVKEYL